MKCADTDSFCATENQKKEYKMAKKIDDPACIFGMRNYKFETHDADGNVTWDISEDAWENTSKHN